MSIRVLRVVVWMAAAILATACGINYAERNNTGNTLTRRESNDEAIAAYYQAQVVLPDRIAAYYNAAAALASSGDYAAAVATLTQALRTADEDQIGQVYYNMGNVYFLWGRFTDAITAYQEVLLRDPDDADARYNMELALAVMIAPTPTALEQQVEPEEGFTDPDATPTNNPAGRDGPTPTPLPQEGPPDPTLDPVTGGDETGGGVKSTPVPRPEGRMTVEEAERQLDIVLLNQQTLREFLQMVITPGAPADKDW